MKYFLIAYLIWNLLVFLLYGWDKLSAKRGAWRVPERTLLGAALFMGGIGAFLAMQVFRHKTQHKSFTIMVPIFALLNIAVIAFVVYKIYWGK